MLKRAIRVIAAVAGGLLILVAAAGGPSNLPRARAAAQSPVGSWLVVPSGGGPARTNLLTLTSDGLVVWAGGIAAFTGGHGAWMRTGDHTAAFTFLIMRHNAGGDYVGLSKSRGTISFDAGFEHLAGKIHTETFNAQGKLVGSADFASRGTRIHVETM